MFFPQTSPKHWQRIGHRELNENKMLVPLNGSCQQGAHELTWLDLWYRKVMLIRCKNPDVMRRKSPGVQSTDKSCEDLITFTCVACFMQLGLVSAFPSPYSPQTSLVEAAHSKARAPTPLVEATHSKARAPFSNPSEQPYSCNFSWALRVLFLLLPFRHSLTFPFLSPLPLSPFFP